MEATVNNAEKTSLKQLRVSFFLQSSICTFILYYKQIRSKGPSINDVASLEGGRGAKLTIWGDMRGVGVKENPTSSIQDWQITIFFENAIYFNLETDFSLTFEIVTTMQKDSLLDLIFGSCFGSSFESSFGSSFGFLFGFLFGPFESPNRSPFGSFSLFFYLLKVLVSYISVLHNFGFGKVSPAKQL